MLLLDQINDLVDKGYLNVQNHPTLDLRIFNYSKQAQYDEYWNDITLMCRGLVLNSQNEIVARCLPKFFNYSEIVNNENTTLKEKLKLEIPFHLSFEVFEKMDGSYIQIFKYNNEIVISSRGSFTSDHAIKAREILYKKYNHLINQIQNGYNYVFEIIFPANRIVVDYGDMEDLILLTVIKNETGEESLNDIGFPIVKKYQVNKIDEIFKLKFDNWEGVVVKFENNFRFKLKDDEYIRLHRILTYCSSREIWKLLSSGKDLSEIIERVPDEFFNWVKNVEKELLQKYNEIETECLNIFKPIQLLKILQSLTFEELMIKKEIALYIKKHKYRSIVFNMLRGMDYSEIIWKIIEPEWEKPFNLTNQKILNEE